MKQFEFRLQKVMETARIREEVQKRELGQALGELARRQERQAELECSLELHLVEGRTARGAALRVAELAGFHAWAESLAESIRQQRRAVEAAAREVERHREKLIELSRDKKVLERLKEKKYEEFKKKLRGLEQKMMDEVGLRPFNQGEDRGE